MRRADQVAEDGSQAKERIDLFFLAALELAEAHLDIHALKSVFGVKR